MKTKDGVVFIDPHPSVLHAMSVVEVFWRYAFGRQATVTSGRDGTHSANSLHYGTSDDVRERAFDVRTYDLTPEQLDIARRRIPSLLGAAYDVVFESTHLHIEVDLKSAKMADA